MPLEYLIKIFQANQDANAIVWDERTYTYKWILKKYYYWKKWLENKDLKKGMCVAIEADFSPNSICLLLALIDIKTIVVPLTESVKNKMDEFLKISNCERKN